MDILHEEAGTNGYGSGRYMFRFQPNGTSTPKLVNGNYITSITYSGTGTGIYLVNFASTFNGSLLFMTHGLQSNTGGPAEGFSFEVDQAQTSLTPATGGAVVAIAGVNASGTRATIANDANTLVFIELVFSFNTTFVP
jgi:hypothetical protein